jgi:DNA-binding transcriptional LysR family regulator
MTSEAIFVCSPSKTPFAFSPPTVRTGMVSLVSRFFRRLVACPLNLPPHEQIAALVDRRIDMGFVPLPVVELDPAIEFEPVREVELMVALPPGHRLAKQHRLALRKLAHEPFVMLKRSSATCCTTGFPVYAARPASSRRLFNSPKVRRAFSNWSPPGLARRSCRGYSRDFPRMWSSAHCRSPRQSSTCRSLGVATTNPHC